MQLATETTQSMPTANFTISETTAQELLHSQYKVIRRNGAVVGFEPSKIAIAMTKAFIAVNGGQGAASARPSAGPQRQPFHACPGQHSGSALR